MISAALALASIPYSSVPGLKINIFMDEPRAVLTATFSGVKPEGLKIIHCGHSNFWPEVRNDRGLPVPMTDWGQEAKAKLFHFKGAMRDYSWDILSRKKDGPWRLGDFSLKALYRLKPGQSYWVRGIYDNVGDGESAKFVSRFVEFVPTL